MELEIVHFSVISKFGLSKHNLYALYSKRTILLKEEHQQIDSREFLRYAEEIPLLITMAIVLGRKIGVDPLSK